MPDYGQVECRQVFRGGLQHEDDGSGIGMAFRSCHGEERKVKGNQPAVGRDTRFGTLHLSGLVCPSGESISRGGEMYPFGHGLRAGNFGGVLPQFHKEIREKSRNQS